MMLCFSKLIYYLVHQFISTLRTTFVFAQWWAFEDVFVPRDQTLNEDNTLTLHVTPPLRKHFVGRWPFCRPF
jgi:hypothetical protein